MKRYGLLAVLTAVFAAGLTAGVPGVAQAQVTSDQMTCEQAIATYERDRRIYVRSSGGAVLPIYRPVPLSERNQLFCHGRDSSRSSYGVRTLDKRRCTIGYTC